MNFFLILTENVILIDRSGNVSTRFKGDFGNSQQKLKQAKKHCFRILSIEKNFQRSKIIV